MQMRAFFVKDSHVSPVTCLQWSLNAMKLFSGDSMGLVVCTEIDYESVSDQGSDNSFVFFVICNVVVLYCYVFCCGTMHCINKVLCLYLCVVIPAVVTDLFDVPSILLMYQVSTLLWTKPFLHIAISYIPHYHFCLLLFQFLMSIY